ncbi:phosphate ABC transporter substrate-binding protein [uncultured Psychrosphaera sp.]|jgi:ABC-type phosphate transport system substrate-binding protein|uniref:phosphate ABC transporter substrate-binding protein n=1 Tax=uncultured Psychrosphaera sp. TaxID=1403522 RepID=UPI00261C57F3|nr:phosphate ABC transporter substrate-binding protein [uncultured Psychrosphaera sp.]
MKFLKTKLCITILGLTSVFAQAEIAVVVHPSNASALDSSAISRIFLGKLKSFDGGGQAVPINQESSMAATDEFNSKVLNKSGSQLKSYWSKLVFTGKGTPPKVVANDAEVISLISANPNLIGYIDATAVTGTVKVIAKF